MLGNMKLFLVLNRMSHSFALPTREISWSTLEINFIFPHMYYSLYNKRSILSCVGSVEIQIKI